MDILKLQLHHERANTREYSDSDHRVDAEVCRHTRFLDRNFPVITLGTCLDCGGVIAYETWSLLEGGPFLTDDMLIKARAHYNLLHRGFVFDLDYVPPDLQVASDLFVPPDTGT